MTTDMLTLNYKEFCRTHLVGPSLRSIGEHTSIFVLENGKGKKGLVAGNLSAKVQGQASFLPPRIRKILSLGICTQGKEAEPAPQGLPGSADLEFPRLPTSELLGQKNNLGGFWGMKSRKRGRTPYSTHPPRNLGFGTPGGPSLCCSGS